MSKSSQIELTPHLIEKTVSRFRNHRPVVDREFLADPKLASDPYIAYDFSSAAADVLLDLDMDILKKRGAYALRHALEVAAEEQVPNAEQILERRQKAADMLNRAFRLKHGID